MDLTDIEDFQEQIEQTQKKGKLNKKLLNSLKELEFFINNIRVEMSRGKTK